MSLRQWAFLASVALAGAAYPSAIHAQPSVEAQVGTFLTRERGWNWELNVVARLGLVTQWSSDWRGVGHVTGRVSACPCGTEPAVSPPPSSMENGVGVGYDVQRQLLDRRLAGLLGVEWFQVVGEERAAGGTLVSNVGASWSWGRRRAWGSEIRYGAFMRRLSSTRGRLGWSIVRRW